MSTATRILLGFLLIVAAAFYLLMDKLTDRVERQYLEAAEEPMVDAAHLFASMLEQEIEGGKIDFANFRGAFEGAKRREFKARIYSKEKSSVDMNVYVTDTKGIVLFDSREGEAEGRNFSDYRDVSLTLNGAYGARSSRTDEENDRSSVMFVGAPIRNGGEIIGVVSVSKPQASMFVFIAETKGQIRYYGWSVLIAIMLAAMLVSHWFSSPIRKLTEYARAVRRGERVAMPKLKSPEARTLGRALDEMRDSLEDRKYVETYVQTLTHEMKSPVAAIRGASELLEEDAMPAEQRKRFMENIRTETERLQNIIDRLLALSAIESMKTLENPEDVVLTELVDEVCASHEHAFEARQVALRRDYEGRELTVRGEAFLLEIAAGNLLQNALEFSAPGGTVTIRVARDREKGIVEVAVEDEGPGVPGYAKDRVFDRFYSLQHPGTGKKSSGLGLCFVREAAELHGGEARLENREQGGARAVLTVRG